MSSKCCQHKFYNRCKGGINGFLFVLSERNAFAATLPLLQLKLSIIFVFCLFILKKNRCALYKNYQFIILNKQTNIYLAASSVWYCKTRLTRSSGARYNSLWGEALRTISLAYSPGTILYTSRSNILSRLLNYYY